MSLYLITSWEKDIKNNLKQLSGMFPPKVQAALVDSFFFDLGKEMKGP